MRRASRRRDQAGLERLNHTLARLAASNTPVAGALDAAEPAPPDWYRRLVTDAQHKGQLPAVLSSVADYLRRQHNARCRIRRSMFRPVVVTLIAVFTASVVAWVYTGLYGAGVVGEQGRVAVFRGFGMDLPEVVEAMVCMQSALRPEVVWRVAIVPAGAAVLYVVWALRTARGAPWVSRLPFVGRLWWSMVLARFYGLLALQVRHEQPLALALTSAGAASGCRRLAAEAGRAAERVQSGETLSRALTGPWAGPSFGASLLGQAEQHDRLTVALGGLADLHASETAALADRLEASALARVLMTVLIAIGVAYSITIVCPTVLWPLVFARLLSSVC